ncbi:hypothetical protein [Streptomyces sp. KR55]|uniref:hypothetical protein n=1 Tax=Streptomyces sp. KR55 TaxID=3457425 RepID=UPI003FD684D8
MSGAPELIPGLVAVVVGVHFLPLATLFRQPRFHLTGALMIAVGAAGCGLDSADGPAGSAQLTVDIGAALILWGTACLARHEPVGPANGPEAEEHPRTS